MHDITAYQPINIDVLAGVLGFSGDPSARTLTGLARLLKKRDEYLTKTKNPKTAVINLNACSNIVTGAFKVYDGDYYYIIIYAVGTNEHIVKQLRSAYRKNNVL